MKRTFYGRQWLFEKIEDIVEKDKNLDEPKYRGVVILGQAGSGKTTVCQQLLHPNKRQSTQNDLFEKIIAYHFCDTNDKQSLDVYKFVENIALQLYKNEKLAEKRRQYYMTQIANIMKDEHKNEDIVNIFKKVIVCPLQDYSTNNERLIILVDSIDESMIDNEGSNTDAIDICNLFVIALQQCALPSWLKFVITTRRQSREIIKMFSGMRKVTLDDLKKSYVVKDVQQYILDRLDSEVELRKHLTHDTAEMFNLLQVKSNGCILYLEQILDNIIKGVLTIQDAVEIPGTLNGLYLWLCQRLFPQDIYETHYRPILEILLASRQNLNFDDLFDIMKMVKENINEKQLCESLSKLMTVLQLSNGRYHFIHHSFCEWLTDVKHCTRRYLCNVSRGNAMLAVYLMCKGKTLTEQENENFLWHLLHSQYPSSDPSKLDQWLKWSGVHGQDVESFGENIKIESSHILRKPLPSTYKDGVVHLKKEDQPDSHVHINKDEDWTVLLKAAFDGNNNEVRSLIQKGADINFVNRKGQSSLNIACSEGHFNIVYDLINCGSEINTRDSDGCTPLRAAARCGSSDIVRLLLKHGAIPDLADNEQRTALRAASWGGHTDIVLQLLQKGADPNHLDRAGHTALIAASYNGFIKTVEVLLDHNANVNHNDSDGRTALSVCIISETLINHVDVIKLLLDYGAEVDRPDYDGMTALCLACMLGNKNVVQLLLQRNADVGHWDRNGRTPLLLACANGHHSVVKILLEFQRGKQGTKKEIFKKDNSGWSPLSLAAFHGHEQVVQLLLFYGASLNELDAWKRSPLMLTAHEGHTSLLEQLLQAGCSVNLRSLEGRSSLHYATIFGHISCVEKLLEKEADVNLYDSNGATPLNYAAKGGNSKLCEVLLKGGAKVNCQDQKGRTPLHVAAWSGFFNVAEKLIEYGADVNHMCLLGYTPLMTAAWQGHTSILNLLLKKNALVDVMSSNDKASALNIAAQQGHEDVVRLLLNYNASIVADRYGRDPKKVALQAGHRGIVNIIDSFNSLAVSDGNFTDTLKRQFPKLTKGSSNVDVLASKQKKIITRQTSNSSSFGNYGGSSDMADSNASISSNDPIPSFDEEYSHSYNGPFSETTTRMSSMSSFKLSQATVQTNSTVAIDEEVFFSRSSSQTNPFDSDISYHGFDPAHLKNALEISSTETVL